MHKHYSPHYFDHMKHLHNINITTACSTVTCNKLYSLYAGATCAPAAQQVVTLTATQSFHIGGHCTCRIPSLEFLGLPVPRIWSIFNHGINHPSGFDL